ncbi:hypothetical protein D6827_00325 [Candidatus Parcubacteria bacterium]|nr:MAG: hypothetical protein D6827_00325 [Candidatus Parcubacteria bacterium]
MRFSIEIICSLTSQRPKNITPGRLGGENVQPWPSPAPASGGNREYCPRSRASLPVGNRSDQVGGRNPPRSRRILGAAMGPPHPLPGRRMAGPDRSGKNPLERRSADQNRSAGNGDRDLHGLMTKSPLDTSLF